MNRYLVTCWPFVGHVVPQLSIAAALRERGAEVAFYTGQAGRERVQGARFQLFPFTRVDEPAVTDAVRRLEQSAGAGRPRLRDVQRCFRTWLVDSIPDQVADLDEVIGRWRPDVIVCDLSMWAPIVIVGERSGIPVALSSTFLGPPAPSPEVPPPGLGLPSPKGPVRWAAARAVGAVTDLLAHGLRRRVDQLRAVHGLAPMGCSVNEFMGRLPLTTVQGVRELDYGRRTAPPRVHYIGICRWVAPDPAAADAWRQLDERRPWVHVASATMQGADPFMLRAAVRGLANGPWELIATTGGAPLAGDLSAGLAPNVHVSDWVDHGELLPRCSAMVTAGGTGAILAALAAGVPLVVVPTTWDKPDNAQRVVEAGVGVRIAPRRCTPENLRRAVKRVLGDSSYRENARRVAGLLASAPGPAGAADLLEQLAAAPAPATSQRSATASIPGGV